ncbi:response regulator [Acinetobacter terrae]|uniref:Response regulator transcription factor n=1 Tax=Acinetobacter terrae TaxID=2731247 RepID=A0A4R0EPW4_9GAMM|nr:response regulator transcription factor [Acinetobacter terrae]NNH15701.1 response regulator transcription factor [Acinetobacter terrae]TCB61105.1 response regulator transcription factor [Acinetobacter terrae]
MAELMLPVPIMLIEDQPAFNHLLESILVGIGYPAELIMSTDHLAEAEQLLQQHLPNLILIDLSLDHIATITFIKQLKKIHPDANVIAVLAQQQTSLLFDAIQAGAQGYIFHEDTEAEILKNIKSILRGGAPIHHVLAQYILSHQVESKQIISTAQLNTPIHLSAIEYEILNLVSGGLNLQQVAEQTSTSLYKIEGNIKSTYRKIAYLKN